MKSTNAAEEKEAAFNARLEGYNHQNDHSPLGQFAGLLIVVGLVALVAAPFMLALSGIYQRFTVGTVPAWCVWC